MAEQGIYTVGGTVQANGQGVYITRQADEDLMQLCLNSTFAYVLTPRQMGKSSLMIRTSERLIAKGIQFVIIDLTEIGTSIAMEDWYTDFLDIVARQLALNTNVKHWWQTNIQFGITRRLIHFFQDVVLEEVTSPIVIFVDEIDTTLNLNFTDDFYAAIRHLYVSRAYKTSFQRLSFVLIGVATPGSLILDPKRTPFNIGQRVELTDFTLAEAMPLSEGLGLPAEQSKQVLELLLQWTGGHPYLTQRLCKSLVNMSRSIWSSADIDQVVKYTFFEQGSKNDSNLMFVSGMVISSYQDNHKILTIYRNILLNDQKILDDEKSISVSRLKLSGIAISNNGYLKVRNLIYKEVFNKKWINDNLPAKWRNHVREMAGLAVLIFISILIPISIFAFMQRQIAEQKSKEADKQRQIAEQKSKEADNQRLLVENLLLGGSSRVAKQDLSPEVKAFLDTIAWSVSRLPANGYKQKFSGEEFKTFDDHPREKICGEHYGFGKQKICVDSAGRYHIISSTWDTLARRLKLRDFSPESQDLAVIELLRECGALENLKSGNLELAIHKASYLWVTFPDESGKSRFRFKAYSTEDLKFMYSIFYARYKT
jgi:muramidase (phage lysozyme)